jgi:hypothetical protein
MAAGFRACKSSTKHYRNMFRWTSPGSFLGLRNGMNLAPMANAMAGPNMNPLASIPEESQQKSEQTLELAPLGNSHRTEQDSCHIQIKRVQYR